MKAKKLWVFAIAFCMVLCMMPVEAFATEETNQDCICSISCSEQKVNEDCEVCSKDFKECAKAKQRTAVSTQEEKTSETTTEKKEEVTTKATTEKKEEVTTKATTEKKEEVTTKATTEEKEEVTTKATTEEKEEVTTKETTQKQEVTTKATEKEEDTVAQGDSPDETKVNVNEENFPDEAFRNWIIKNIPGAEDSVLTTEEIEAVKEISVSGQGIKNLEGIKNFKNLESLDCTDNNLTTLDLTGLDALKTVKATGQKSTATAIEREDDWGVDMEGIVGMNNVGKVKFVQDSLPEGYKYTVGVLIIPKDSLPETVKYNYPTGANQDMEVILTLNKKVLAPELDKTELDFGEKCVGTKVDKQTLKIENKSVQSIQFEIANTTENSNYNINTYEGTIESGSTVEIEVVPKDNLQVGEYQEDFSIKIDGTEAKTFSASLKVVDHTLVWKIDKEPTSTEEGYGHYECSNCDYKGEKVNIGIAIDVNEKNFPDEAFRNWIIENISGADDKVLTTKDIEAVKNIEVPGKAIKSLEGIKIFKNLETLDCSNNNLTTLDLTGLDALKTVSASGQEAIASVVEEEDGWKLDMKEIVGEDNIENISFADDALPSNAEYKDGVVIFSTTPEINTLTYQYKTGTDTDLEVTLALTKKALPDPEPDPIDPSYTITMSKKTFDFGTECVGVQPSKQNFKIVNRSEEDIDFKVVSTTTNSNYNITTEGLTNDGKLKAGDTVTVSIQPKSGLKVGEYKEEFNIKVNGVNATLKVAGEEVKTFSASFKVVEHTDLVKVDAKPATHTSEGNIAYWYCRDCKKYFTDNNGKVGDEIDSSKIVLAKTTTHTANGNGWSRDDDSHWQVCTCGEKINKASHSLVWKVDRQATATQNGYGHYECSVCGYKKSSVTIYATGTTSTTRSTVQTTTATTRSSILSKIIPTTGDDSHIVLWLGVLVICAVAFLGALGRYLSKRK